MFVPEVPKDCDLDPDLKLVWSISTKARAHATHTGRYATFCWHVFKVAPASHVAKFRVVEKFNQSWGLFTCSPFARHRTC